MNRRKFFAQATALAVAPSLPASTAGYVPYGPMEAGKVKGAWRTFVDGALVERVIFADDIAGKVICHVVDENGKSILDGFGKNRHVRTKTLYGVVRLERFR